MRFSFLSLFLLMTVAALAIALLMARRQDEMILVGDRLNTWELEKAVATESVWIDKSKPPRLSLVEVFEIATSISEHLDSVRESTRVGGWNPVALSITRIGCLEDNSWAYVISFEGTDYPEHAGQTVVRQLAVMVLMDKTIIFDSGSQTDSVSVSISDALRRFPGIVDAAPKVNARPVFDGGIF